MRYDCNAGIVLQRVLPVRTIRSMQRLLERLTIEEIERRDRESVADDVAPWQDSTTEERVRAVRALLRLASTSLDCDDENSEARRRWQDPRDEESEALWLKLVADHRSQ